jgi:hypothetical protein
MLQLGDTPVTIYAKDLANIGTDGLHFALPPHTSVELGKLSEFIVWLNSKFTDAHIPVTADTSWPDPIKSIFTEVLDTRIAVTQLTFDQAPKVGKDWPDPEFSISVTGTVAEEVELISGIKLIGGGVGLTRKNTKG